MRKTLAELVAERQTTPEVEVIDWGGPVRLAKLPARERLELLERIGGKADAEGNLPIAVALDEYVWAISKSVQGDDGGLVFDSDEGREFLYGERLDVLQGVFQEVANFNIGEMSAEMESAKKN